jgi:feruloyl esterase
MRHTPHLLAASITLGLAAPASAAFIDDSQAVLARNFYFNRDFRQQGAAQSKAEEWAQGFILRVDSGYTEGPIGVGFDAIGLLGIKLDSSPERTGTGILKSDREAPKRAQDEYGEAGLTAKLRASNSTLKLGTLQPLLPALMRNDSRLLPQTFRGAWLRTA